MTGSSTVSWIYRDCPTVLDRKLVCDGETQTTPTRLHTARRFKAMKWPEYGLDLVCRNAGAAITNIYGDCLFAAEQCDVDRFVIAMLCRVLHEVGQYSFQRYGIGEVDARWIVTVQA